MSTHKEMKDGQRVRVLLHGDYQWRNGTVIRARKEWVELDADDPIAPMIADEGSIKEWEPLPVIGA